MDKEYYKKHYGDYDEIDLPRTHRTYFDAHCHEFTMYPIEDKLLDIAYVVTHGFDIKKAVRKIMKIHPHVSENAIHRAILTLHAKVCNLNHPDFDSTNDLDTDIDILIEDLIRQYRLPLDGSKLHYLNVDWNQPNEQEPYRCNGWEIAANNVNQYQMYKDHNFVFYPGDQEVIIKYNTADVERVKVGQIFPVGTCPEPWYGNPMTAKIIILGNMPINNDYINRCANLILGRFPQLAEVIQGMVRHWMSLSLNTMYIDNEFGDLGLSIGEAYNSITYRHWIDELKNLSYEMGIDPQFLFDRTCVINANAYYAVGGEDPLAAGILPSQYYLRTLLNFLVHGRRKDILFIVPSPKIHKSWKKILSWAETHMMVLCDYILIKSPNTKLRLSKDVLGKENVQRILKRLS